MARRRPLPTRGREEVIDLTESEAAPATGGRATRTKRKRSEGEAQDANQGGATRRRRSNPVDTGNVIVID